MIAVVFCFFQSLPNIASTIIIKPFPVNFVLYLLNNHSNFPPKHYGKLVFFFNFYSSCVTNLANYKVIKTNVKSIGDNVIYNPVLENNPYTDFMNLVSARQYLFLSKVSDFVAEIKQCIPWSMGGRIVSNTLRKVKDNHPSLETRESSAMPILSVP